MQAESAEPAPFEERIADLAVLHNERIWFRMVLDHDCVREILLAVEQCPFNQTTNVEKLSKQLPDFDVETIWYACLKMGEGGLLDVVAAPMMGSYLPGIKQITSMTYQGHEFLDTIREKTAWEKTKEIAKKTGAGSIKFLGEIAKEVVKAAATSAYQNLF